MQYQDLSGPYPFHNMLAVGYEPVQTYLQPFDVTPVVPFDLPSVQPSLIDVKTIRLLHPPATSIDLAEHTRVYVVYEHYVDEPSSTHILGVFLSADTCAKFLQTKAHHLTRADFGNWSCTLYDDSDSGYRLRVESHYADEPLPLQRS